MSMRLLFKCLLALSFLGLLAAPGFTEENPAESPYLKVIVCNASGSEKIAGAEVVIQDISDFGEPGPENMLSTDSNGLAAFGKRAFDGFFMESADGGEKIPFDAEAENSSLRGSFKIRVTVRSEGLVSQSSDITVPLGGPMEFTVQLGSDEGS